MTAQEHLDFQSRNSTRLRDSFRLTHFPEPLRQLLDFVNGQRLDTCHSHRFQIAISGIVVRSIFLTPEQQCCEERGKFSLIEYGMVSDLRIWLSARKGHPRPDMSSKKRMPRTIFQWSEAFPMHLDFQETHVAVNSPANRLKVKSASKTAPLNQRLNWCSIKPAAIFAV
jgi:hypothetical protein